MLGCLTLPFRLAAGAVVLAAAAGLWFYRDRVPDAVASLVGGPTIETVGRPEPALRLAAERKLAMMRVGRADSVLLTAGETASLLLSRLDPEMRREFGDPVVRLGRDKVVLEARLRTDRLPRGLFGALNPLVRDVEDVVLGGPVRVVGDGAGEWRLHEIEVRGIPLPTDAARALVRRALDDAAADGIPFPLPARVQTVRAGPAGLLLLAKATE